MTFTDVYHFSKFGLSACYYENGETLEIWRYHDCDDATWYAAVSCIKQEDYIGAMTLLDSFRVQEEK